MRFGRVFRKQYEHTTMHQNERTGKNTGKYSHTGNKQLSRETGKAIKSKSLPAIDRTEPPRPCADRGRLSSAGQSKKAFLRLYAKIFSKKS